MRKKENSKKVEESEDDEAESAKGSARKGRSGKPGRDSAEKKEPVTPSSDRPTRERKVVERYSADQQTARTQVKLALMSQIARLPNKLTTPLCPLSLTCYVGFLSNESM
ncbi:hypothetical protein V6N11_076244 [Hibiscus sabdariffa]|uniref:Uncharacterized protein n=1 Tax=Hibiscus sabdariffa TaxID=183260 RepID=A0ABR2Q5N1_9ROSI